MVRLLISVEGPSEYIFLKQIIVPYLANLDVFVELQNMNGNISLDRIASKLNNLISSYDKVTTLYDFYGFKKKTQCETKESLEDKIRNTIKEGQQNKIIPYIQMYEFEALLFSDAKIMAQNLSIKQEQIDKILLNSNNNPEQINDSPITAPSKRIGAECEYIKTTHAPNTLKQIGLANVRKKCAGFNQWLTQLENLCNQ